ncbi:hypothetical protein NOF04DRAFT_1373619 [Fusarium oxysporum II5]|nr:hypothetical protein NOF04DRAFT_1373619 [Fusarium oxysporum II5]
MIVLLARADKFAPINRYPTITKAGIGIYAIILFICALWIYALVSLIFDWPSDSMGDSLNKRYEPMAGIEQGVSNGPPVFSLARAMHYAKKASEEPVIPIQAARRI